jgi:hypothetical protein
MQTSDEALSADHIPQTSWLSSFDVPPQLPIFPRSAWGERASWTYLNRMTFSSLEEEAWLYRLKFTSPDIWPSLQSACRNWLNSIKRLHRRTLFQILRVCAALNSTTGSNNLKPCAPRSRACTKRCQDASWLHSNVTYKFSDDKKNVADQIIG